MNRISVGNYRMIKVVIYSNLMRFGDRSIGARVSHITV